MDNIKIYNGVGMERWRRKRIGWGMGIERWRREIASFILFNNNKGRWLLTGKNKQKRKRVSRLLGISAGRIIFFVYEQRVFSIYANIMVCLICK
jgi:hypothetical protein